MLKYICLHIDSFQVFWVFNGKNYNKSHNSDCLNVCNICIASLMAFSYFFHTFLKEWMTFKILSTIYISRLKDTNQEQIQHQPSEMWHKQIIL